MTTATMPRPRADRRRWWILAVLCLSVLLTVVDNTIVNVALPTMSRTLSASTQDLQWIVDAYTLVFAGLLLVGGNLGEPLADHPGGLSTGSGRSCSRSPRSRPGCPARPAS